MHTDTTPPPTSHDGPKAKSEGGVAHMAALERASNKDVRKPAAPDKPRDLRAALEGEFRCGKATAQSERKALLPTTSRTRHVRRQHFSVKSLEQIKSRKDASGLGLMGAQLPPPPIVAFVNNENSCRMMAVSYVQDF